jgi:hypothetical protein
MQLGESEMAETTIHVGENSAEHVAFKLLIEIAAAEGRELFHDLLVIQRVWVP